MTEAVRIVHEAIDAGINFLDNAWEYHDGESERRMGRAIADRRAIRLPDDQGLHARARRRRRDAPARAIAAPPAAPTTSTSGRFTSASTRTIPSGISRAAASSRRWSKRRHKARFATSASPATRIPTSTCACCRHGFPFDACQLPLNGFDATFRSFQASVLPELARRRIAAIGMKSLGGDGRVIKKKAATCRRRACAMR